MEPIKALEVTFENRKVGTLALTADRQTAFQYAVAKKFNLSPDYYITTAEMIRAYVNEDLADIIGTSN